MKSSIWLLIALALTALCGCEQASEARTPRRRPAGQAPAAPATAEKQTLPPPAHNFGYQPRPQETQAFLKSLDKPTLREANPKLFEPEKREPRPKKAVGESQVVRGPPMANLAATDKEPVFLYKALLAVRPGWQVGAQGIGDCVSWGWAHAADVSLAVDYKLGATGTWLPASSEAIYGGARVEGAGRPEGSGGYGDGSYGAAAAKWVNKVGGIVYRKPFAGYDLTQYDKSRAKQWGNWGCGGQGDKGYLDKVATEHPVLQVALVRNFEEAAAAIESGYPVPVCSGQGFSSTRDKDGFCSPAGSWSHCMCFTAVRYDRPGLLCQNSWGPSWVKGPKFPGDQPDGSFWVDQRVVDRMLAGNDSFAVSQIKGFPKRKLEHWKGW